MATYSDVMYCNSNNNGVIFTKDCDDGLTRVKYAPCDVANADYAAIEALVVAGTLTIKPYVAGVPATTSELRRSALAALNNRYVPQIMGYTLTGEDATQSTNAYRAARAALDVQYPKDEGSAS